ncbi:MAG: PD-(D/E)XK nuclease family protein [Parvularculaceae bacterium]
MPDTNLSKGPPNITELENLFINNDALEKIESFLERFNPIRVMRMENMEIRHSAILAWLLDPNESHGLNDIFLKSFLAAALKGTDHSPPTALEIIQADLGDAQISRERHNIDIFIYCPRNAWSFVIENKYHSSQNDGQLQRYRERAEKDAEDSGKVLHSRGIFLTLHEEEPKDDSYATIRYRDVTEILSSHIKLRGDNLSAEVCLFLKHYLEIIEEAAGMSKPKENMQALAKQLYRTHRRVIDFIVEHGASTEFALCR